MAPQMITDREVAAMLGVSRDTVWRWTRNKADFPKPSRIGDNATRWLASEVLAYRDARIQASRSVMPRWASAQQSAV